MEPSVVFNNSHLYTMPYGRMADGSVMIGSLELLQSSNVLTLFNTSDPAMRTGSAGEETAAQIRAEIPDEGYDLVIMNPPFTRATNHEGTHAAITNPAFAAFDATRADQTAMGERANKLAADTCYHGNAGVASAFAALAHKKLKPSGVLALVLPLSLANGLSWRNFRRMVERDYNSVAVFSIAANGSQMSFSSDTSMAECLVVARRRKPYERRDYQAHFASLQHRPQGFGQPSALASTILHSGDVRRIENRPYGGTRLRVGGESAGEIVAVPYRTRGRNWGAVRLSDHSLAQSAYALSRGSLWLPGNPSSVALRTMLLGRVGKLGLVDRDINGPTPRGPFNKTTPGPTATYPALWNHHARQEKRIVCLPDSQLIVRPRMEDRAADVWATASRAHLNRDFTFGSQALAIAFTEMESIGERVWPNVIFSDKRFDYAFSVWGNSTLGLLSYWWHSSRQQSSKASITISTADSLPVLDLRALTDEQLRTAEAIFNEFRDKDLKPAYLADADPNRALLDRRVICDLIGFDEDTYVAVRRLAAKWCAEPSVHGGKARPRNARFVS